MMHVVSIKQFFNVHSSLILVVVYIVTSSSPYALVPLAVSNPLPSTPHKPPNLPLLSTQQSDFIVEQMDQIQKLVSLFSC